MGHYFSAQVNAFELFCTSFHLFFLKSYMMTDINQNRNLCLGFSELFLMTGIKNSVKVTGFLHCAKWCE